MTTLTPGEIGQKLVDLKVFSRDYDAQRRKMMYSYGTQKEEAYKAMLEAEKKYLALSDWFINQGIHIFWDRQRQEYIVVPSIHTQ